MADGRSGSAGNGDWVGTAAARYAPDLTLYAGHLLGGDAERAADVVQETFAKLLRQDRAAVEGHLGPWLFAVCRRAATDARRKEKRMTLATEDEVARTPHPAPTPAEAAETTDATAAMLRRLSQLPPNQQEVVRLKFLHGMSYAEIANVTSLSVSNVGFLLHTALKALRERMTAEMPRRGA